MEDTSVELRIAFPGDAKEVRKLWEYCFDDPIEFNDWFFNNRYKSENTLVVTHDNHIASALQMLPYTIQLRGVQMKTSYLVGVSTWPEDRGKGYITRLLHYALEEMRKRGQWVSILLPFKYEFYRKYGWETCYSHVLFDGSVESFDSYTGMVEISGQFRPVNADKDIPLLAQSYSQFTKQLNGFVERDSLDWARLLKDINLDSGYAYLYMQGENVLGYMIYYIKNRQLSIREMSFSDEKSKLEMLRFAVNHSDMIDHIQWKSPAIYIYNPLLQKYGIKWSENPFVMGRIVDAAKALETILQKYKDVKLDFTIQIIDPFLDWNNKTYRIKSTTQSVSISPTTQTPDFTISITVLAQLLWGYISLYQAIHHQLIVVSNPTKLKQISTIFYETIPYIYEDY